MSDTKYPTGRRVAFKNSTGVEEITANGTYGPIEVRGDLRAFSTYVKKVGATQVDATVKLMATNYPAVAEGGAEVVALGLTAAAESIGGGYVDDAPWLGYYIVVTNLTSGATLKASVAS